MEALISNWGNLFQFLQEIEPKWIEEAKKNGKLIEI